MSRLGTTDPPRIDDLAPEPRRRATRWPLYLGLAAGVLLALALLAFTAWALRQAGQGGDSGNGQAAKVPVAWGRTSVAADELADRVGVTITRVAVSGGGGLLDLRYQVLDPDKAGALHDTSTPPAIVDERTGLVVHNLLMDHAHSGPFKAGVTYYYIFDNPGNWVRHGSRVTVLLGTAEVEHVVVQ